jgi:2-polyprenyl-6-methoxyphenol hydroxylase-like FAD-dependent oxidoreductase
MTDPAGMRPSGPGPGESARTGADTDVLVVGAGPTGLMTACELRLAGVRCRVLERRGEESNLTRAFGLHSRALELLDGRGLAEEIVGRGVPIQRMHPAWGPARDL